MLNYYKILRIPDYSGGPEVRRAFLKMAKQYHPDVNKNRDAEEIFKLVNKANETLSNPALKKVYDQRLKAGYFFEGIQKYRSGTSSAEQRMRAVKKQKEERAKRSRETEIKNYQKSLDKFPFFARIGSFSLLLIYGMFMWYKYWIVNYADYSVYVLTFGIFCTILGIVMLIDTTYKRLRIKQFTSNKNSHYEKISMWMLVTMVVLIPYFIVQVSDYRKQYHLKHYGEFALAKVTGGKSTGQDVTYSYKIDDKLYEKHSSDLEKVYSLDGKHWLIVKYSRVSPVLAEPVDYIKHAHELIEIYK